MTATCYPLYHRRNIKEKR